MTPSRPLSTVDESCGRARSGLAPHSLQYVGTRPPTGPTPYELQKNGRTAVNIELTLFNANLDLTLRNISRDGVRTGDRPAICVSR